MKKKNLLISSIVTLVLLTITIIGTVCIIKSNSDYIEVGKTTTGISVKTKYSLIRFDFADISDIKKEPTQLNNTWLDGFKSINCQNGVFENEKYGSYYSFVYNKSCTSLVLSLKNLEKISSSYVIISLKSDSETDELYDFISSNINL